ncbi:MAG TPA: choice-of-anchor tandem repeat GloVer-containing protein [Capsulimonadaceae bacterium]|jgi:uncharacterized repeat protein (TIGR03803 family)
MRFATLILLLLGLLATPVSAAPTAKLRVLHEFGHFVSGLVQGADGKFYGVSSNGGDTYQGEVFSVTTSGVRVMLHSFSGGDGAYPRAALIDGGDGFFYGTTHSGGASNMGTVFKVAADGTFTSLYSFSGPDGSYPVSSLVKAKDGKFYGTTEFGGSTNDGTTFVLSASSSFAMLHSFSGADGSRPKAGLIQAKDGYFYGTTYGGGATLQGLIYKMTTMGVVTSLHELGAGDGWQIDAGLLQGSDGLLYGVIENDKSGGNGSNIFTVSTSGDFKVICNVSEANGDRGVTSLTEAPDGAFYGVTASGGTNNSGAVFKVGKDGSFTSVCSFDGYTLVGPCSPLTFGRDGKLYGATSAFGASAIFAVSTIGYLTIVSKFETFDGERPNAALVRGSNGSLYSTTVAGGAKCGTVFRVARDGAYSIVNCLDSAIASNPYYSLLLASDGNLYGTSATGGPNGLGSVYKVLPDGTATVVHSFSIAEGARPTGELVQARDGYLYGLTFQGGRFGKGTAYRMALSGSLTLLHNFSDAEGDIQGTGLMQAVDGNFYSISRKGSPATYSVFKMTPNGTVSILYTLGSSDGKVLTSTPIQYSDGSLYGTVMSGDGLYGGIYKLKLSGEFDLIHKFDGSIGGAYPTSTLCLLGNGELYGTTSYGWPNTSGNVYVIQPDKTLSIVYSFEGAKDSVYPLSSLVQGDDGRLYGTSWYGGANNLGTVFSLDLGLVTPAPTITPNGGTSRGYVTVTFADTLAGASIYYTTDGSDPATSGTAQRYTAPFTLSHTATVTALAKAPGYANSQPVSATFTVTGSSYPAGLNFFASAYDYPGLALDTLFGYSGVKLAVWSPTANAYSVTPTSPAGELRLGVGYWARFPKAVTVTTTGTVADMTKPFVINLKAGWNMIGDPVMRAVALSDVTFGSGVSFDAATNSVSPTVAPFVWEYNATKKAYVKATALEPLKGYWLYAYKSTTMTIPGVSDVPPPPPI